MLATTLWFLGGYVIDVHGVALGVLIVAYIAFMVAWCVVNWKLFTKMGEPGWASLIPAYNMYVAFQRTRPGNARALVISFGILACLSSIPYVGVVPALGALVIAAVWNVDVGALFGKDRAFSIGLVLLPVIFLGILAFGSSRYVGPRGRADASPASGGPQNLRAAPGYGQTQPPSPPPPGLPPS